LKSIYRQQYPNLEVFVTDDGSTDGTEKIKDEFPQIIFNRIAKGREGWTNPSRPMNVGFRRATGEYCIMQSAEIIHQTDCIRQFVAVLKEHPDQFAFARVVNWKDGQMGCEYCGPTAQRPIPMLAAYRTEHIQAIRGMDEDFTMYGDDDTDLFDRLTKGLGLTPFWHHDIFGLHQDHIRLTEGTSEMSSLYNMKTAQWAQGYIDHVRNKDREWGALDDG
jgi:glycosyltransferase involved in cell wall biosynthesis